LIDFNYVIASYLAARLSKIALQQLESTRVHPRNSAAGAAGGSTKDFVNCVFYTYFLGGGVSTSSLAAYLITPPPPSISAEQACDPPAGLAGAPHPPHNAQCRLATMAPAVL